MDGPIFGRLFLSLLAYRKRLTFWNWPSGTRIAGITLPPVGAQALFFVGLLALCWDLKSWTAFTDLSWALLSLFLFTSISVLHHLSSIRSLI